MTSEYFADAVERYFPYDGPYSPDSVADAVTGAWALVRYVSNATRPGTGTLAWAATVDRVTAGVHALVSTLDQVLYQLAEAIRRQASDPALYDDRGDRPAAQTAYELAHALDTARECGGALAAALTRVRHASSHLGNQWGAAGEDTPACTRD